MGEKVNLDTVSLQNISPCNEGAGTQGENYKEIGKEMTQNPQCVGQCGYVGGKLIWNIEESRERTCNLKDLRRTCG